MKMKSLHQRALPLHHPSLSTQLPTSSPPPVRNHPQSTKTHINSHIAQLRPAHRMVQVVLAKVVLGQIRNIRKLHVRNVAGAEEPNIHLFSAGGAGAGSCRVCFLGGLRRGCRCGGCLVNWLSGWLGGRGLVGGGGGSAKVVVDEVCVTSAGVANQGGARLTTGGARAVSGGEHQF